MAAPSNTWHNIVFSMDDNIDPDHLVFQRQIDRLRTEFLIEIAGLTIFRQVGLYPHTATYFFPALCKLHLFLFRAFRLQECEAPNREFVHLYYGCEDDLDGYCPEPDGSKSQGVEQLA